jgi:ferredoxin
MKVKVMVNAGTCTACALCYEDVHEIYEDRGDGIARVKSCVGGDAAILKSDKYEEELLDRVLEVTEECPPGALITEVLDE